MFYNGIYMEFKCFYYYGTVFCVSSIFVYATDVSQ